MKEYIEKDAAVKAAKDGADEWDGGYSLYRDAYIKCAINRIPAADVVEVKHGRWILNTVRDEWQQFHSDPECSECGFHPYYYHDHSVMKYCPNCGAKMDEGVNDGV